MATKKKTTDETITTAETSAPDAPPPMPIKPERVRYEFILEAETALAHHAESIGNEAIFMRRKMRAPGGRFVEVPQINADTGRHKMREASAYALLDASGALTDPSLSESALRLLFAGGAVSGKGDGGTVKLDTYHRLCDLVPTMRLFGGCAENRIVPGFLTVQDMTLICAESVGFIPAWAIAKAREILGTPDDEGFETMRACIEEETRVRMDPLLNPRNHLLLNAGARAGVERKLLASETAHVEDDAVGAERSKSSMMPRKAEVLAPGSLLFWAVEATVYNALERDTLDTAVWAFMANAVVGGKTGTGHGRIRPLAVQEIINGQPFGQPRVRFGFGGSTAQDIDPTDARATPGALFRAHVEARAEQVRSFLREVDA